MVHFRIWLGCPQGCPSGIPNTSSWFLFGWGLFLITSFYSKRLGQIAFPNKAALFGASIRRGSADAPWSALPIDGRPAARGDGRDLHRLGWGRGMRVREFLHFLAPFCLCSRVCELERFGVPAQENSNDCSCAVNGTQRVADVLTARSKAPGAQTA